MVPEISSATDIIFCHFGQYFNHLPPKHPKNQNFEKMKKSCGHIIILHKCIKNQDHMVYCSWDMACDKCNCYFSFCTIFCPFTPNLPEKWKLKEKKKMKRTPGYIIIICNTVPEIWHMTDVITIVHFRLIFALLPP